MEQEISNIVNFCNTGVVAAIGAEEQILRPYGGVRVNDPTNPDDPYLREDDSGNDGHNAMVQTTGHKQLWI